MANTGKTGGTSHEQHTGQCATPGQGQGGQTRGGQTGAGTGIHTGGNVGAAAVGTAQDLTRRAGEVAGNVGHMAGQAVSGVGSQMESLADRLRENAPREGVMGSAAASVADTLEAGGRYLREQDLGDIGEDLTNLIRPYPIAAVLTGIGIGYLLARAIRS